MAIDTEERGKAAPKGGAAPGVVNNNKKVLKIVLIVVGILIVLAILSTVFVGMFAKKAIETGLEAATGGNVKIDAKDDGSNKIKMKDKDGGTVEATSGKELPQDLPPETPLYKGAKLSHSTVTTVGDGGASYVLMFHTNDSAKDVFKFYKSALNSNGWKTNTTQQSDSYNMIAAENKAADMRMSYSDMLNEKDKPGLDFSVSVSTKVSKN